ncbi:ABC transporter substrate-binding protein [Peptoniphilus catoniae]|uniref:ABC transporter substrate-binding protein n=1 Tax=Peptoniphilus catoniae TaxID=1660341 RepID=UPI0010FD7FBF|nr:ABC transporter substrate-binding protein [Peptoniphilus catoniae]
MKFRKLLLVLAIFALVFTACGKKESQESKENSETASTEATKNVKIGILQFAQHGSLDNCRTGFIKGLADNGFVEGENLTIDYQNAEADMGITSQIANSFVANKYDMIVAIATPAAMSAYNAANGTDIPVIYTAISDPVAAQLANEDGSSVGNITGTSDKLPIDAQLKMIREVLPDAKKIGVLYTTSEANSISMIETYKELAPKYDFELVTESVTTTADIPLATDSILSKVDALTNLTDNTVVNSLPTIMDKAKAKNIPIFGSEIEQVKIGCLASEGIEYVSLGEQTGAMAAKVLKGEAKAQDMPFELISNSSLYLNKEVAKELGIEFSDSLINRASEVFETIEEPKQK